VERKQHDKEAPSDNNGNPPPANVTTGVPAKDLPRCGLVMPISEISGLTAKHWADVRAILVGAMDAAGFVADLVSEAQDVGTIQARILQRLYSDPIVVCDVSAKNPNVMFELGIRLTFDKPTVIVKDDQTGYSFDTSPIEHLTYPQNLRYADIVEFQKRLGEKVRATYEAGKKPEYSTFLKHFGTFTVPRLETKEVSKEQFVLDQLADMQGKLTRLLHREPELSPRPSPFLTARAYGQFSSQVLERIRALSAASIVPPLTERRVYDIANTLLSRSHTPDLVAMPRADLDALLIRLMEEAQPDIGRP
jgi:hypothetical protein